MGAFANDLMQLTSGLVTRAAAEQGGVISGDNPTRYNSNDPIRVWVIQVVIIIGFTQLLSMGLSRIRQPRVIAEVIGGVLLGPTVMGRIPNFRATIFPDESMPLLNLTANIGLVLFLFLVGLEVDVRLIKRNAKVSATISIAGLVIPLGLGAALAVPIYHEFINPSVNFGYFILFVAVAVGITAFPVLCRILTELKLLDTTVGVVVLSAGVGNDVVGWILLALTVALVNSSGGLTALYVLLASVGYVLFLLFPVKWAYKWLARRSGSLESGQPSTSMMTLTLLIVFASAFFTDIIGVHAIFGGFLAGLIIPHEHGYAISLVEKLEDLVSILFLPLYFTYSGLKTNLGLLDNGVTWGYTILICVIAFVSKFFSCGITAKLTGFSLRESGAIGAMMSCKGLVELIVLNVGLQAKILDTRVFSMFVVHALVLTFMTTPLVLWIYPASVRTRADGTSDKRPADGAEEGTARRNTSDDELKTRFSVVLEKLEQLPAAMTLTQLLQHPRATSASTVVLSSAASGDDEKKASSDDLALPSLAGEPSTRASHPRIAIDALRLIELTERTSAVLRSQEADSLLHSDPVVAVFRTFAHLNRFVVSAALAVVPRDHFAGSIAAHARDRGSHMVVVPWSSETEEFAPTGVTAAHPFAGLIHKSQSQASYVQSVRGVFAHAPADVALFVDRGLPTASGSGTHVFLPFFGGPDDRLALSFVVQLCMNVGVSATVVRIEKTGGGDLTPMDTIEEIKAHASAHNTVFPDTVYGPRDTQTRLHSDTADGLLWGRYTSQETVLSSDVADALTRISFLSESSAKPLQHVVDVAQAELARHAQQAMLVVAGRSRRLAVESHQAELGALIVASGVVVGAEVPKTFGDVAAALVTAGVNASLLVVQAAA